MKQTSPVYIFLIFIIFCSSVGIALALDHFGLCQDCIYGTFIFTDYDFYDGFDKGYYHYFSGSGSSVYEKISTYINESGTYEAQRTHDEPLPATVFITIMESTIPERVGVSFSSYLWSGESIGTVIFSNAKQLTCGLAATDTIVTSIVSTSVVDNKKTWSEVKRLFRTKQEE